MVSALDSGSSSTVSSAGRGHCFVDSFWARSFTLTVHASLHPTSFPGSLISPPQSLWGGEMRDPGYEVALHPEA